MIKSSIEKISRDIGFDIGHSDDMTQANLLNGFSDAICQMQDNHKIDMQLCYISDKLNRNAKKVLIELAKFCKEQGDE